MIMPTFSLLLYLLILGALWLFRMAYIGWMGPYLFVCVLWVPILLLALSLPSMLRLRLSLSVQPTLTRNSEGKLTVIFENPSLLLKMGKIRFSKISLCVICKSFVNPLHVISICSLSPFLFLHFYTSFYDYYTGL